MRLGARVIKSSSHRWHSDEAGQAADRILMHRQRRARECALLPQSDRQDIAQPGVLTNTQIAVSSKRKRERSSCSCRPAVVRTV